ncbi:hypothetical protein DINM_000846 [Dirofilaria immitis]|nr:hypothetical protein [Dirofilaria immitis]
MRSVGWAMRRIILRLFFILLPSLICPIEIFIVEFIVVLEKLTILEVQLPRGPNITSVGYSVGCSGAVLRTHREAETFITDCMVITIILMMITPGLYLPRSGSG